MVRFQTLGSPFLHFPLDGLDLLFGSDGIGDERRHVAHEGAVGPPIAEGFVLRVDDQVVVKALFLEKFGGAVVRVNDDGVKGANKGCVLKG